MTATDTTTAADRLRAVLAGATAQSTATLAELAGVGRSTAGKLLAEWAAQGLAVRGTAGKSAVWSAPEDRGRESFLDGIAETYREDAEREDAEVMAAEAAAAIDGDFDPEVEAAERAAYGRPVVAAAQVDGDEPAEDEPSEAERMLAMLDPRSRRILAAVVRADGLRWALTDLGAEVARLATVPARTRRAGAPPAMPKGGLRAEVVAWLKANPGVEITPSKLGTAMGGRSSGAIANALEKLVGDAVAVRTSEKPRTYRLA